MLWIRSIRLTVLYLDMFICWRQLRLRPVANCCSPLCGHTMVVHDEDCPPVLTTPPSIVSHYKEFLGGRSTGRAEISTTSCFLCAHRIAFNQHNLYYCQEETTTTTQHHTWGARNRDVIICLVEDIHFLYWDVHDCAHDGTTPGTTIGTVELGESGPDLVTEGSCDMCKEYYSSPSSFWKETGWTGGG